MDKDDNDLGMSKAIYTEDCEFARYHDGLMWNRFQTVAAIEAAMLYGRYQVASLTRSEKAMVSILGAVLVFLGCSLTFTNRVATRAHLDRLRRIEEEAANVNATLRFDYKKPLFLSAPSFLLVVAVLLTLSNVFVIAKLFCA
jgi:hypothetical protein